MGYKFCFFACGYIVSLTSFVKQTVLTLVRNHLTIYMKVYFWVFSSIPLVYVSVLTLTLHFFDCSRFVLSFELGSVKPLTLILFVQDYVGHLGSLEIPHEF